MAKAFPTKLRKTEECQYCKKFVEDYWEHMKTCPTRKSFFKQLFKDEDPLPY